MAQAEHIDHMEEEYDVVVVGAGMVGATLACALEHMCSAGLRVLVLESTPVTSDESPYQPGYDARSTALSAGTSAYFQALGLWDQLSEHATDIAHIHVSDQGRFGASRLHATDYGLAALGRVVENRWLGRVLNRALLAADTITVRDNCRVDEVHLQDGQTSLQLSGDNGPAQIRAHLLVLAEGGRSGLCEKLGIHRHSRAYEQTAIISNVSFSQPHGNVAYERFTEQGPLALLPLEDFQGEHRSALIWTRRTEVATELMQASDVDFLQRLQQDFGFRLGRFQKVGERQSFALSLVEAEEQYRPGLVLLGNAAHALHPVAGQGFNLALRNAMVLADTITQAHEAGDSPGALAQLQQFAARVSADQHQTILFSDQLTRLFSSSSHFSRLGRRLGLLSIDLLPPLKTHLTRNAMGVGGRKVFVA